MGLAPRFVAEGWEVTSSTEKTMIDMRFIWKHLNNINIKTHNIFIEANES
jgi:hypothetical protein